MLVTIGEISDFQFREHCFNRRRIAEDYRHDHHRPGLGRNSVRKINLRKQSRLKQMRQVPVEDVERKITRGNQRQQRRQHDDRQAASVRHLGKHQQADQQQGQ